MTYVLRLAKKGAIFFGGMYIGSFAVHLIKIFLGLFGIGAASGVAAASVVTGVVFMPVMFLSGRAEGYSDTLSGMYSIVKGPVLTLAVIMMFESLKVHGFLIFIFVVVAVGDAAGYIVGHKICLKRKNMDFDGETVIIPVLQVNESSNELPEFLQASKSAEGSTSEDYTSENAAAEIFLAENSSAGTCSTETFSAETISAETISAEIIPTENNSVSSSSSNDSIHKEPETLYISENT